MTWSHIFFLCFCLICETCFSHGHNSPYWDLNQFYVSYLLIQIVSDFDIFPLCACNCVCLIHYVGMMNLLLRNFLNDCEKMLLRLLSQHKIHWAGRWNFRFPYRKVEKVPAKDDSLWEVKLVEVEEGEEDWMVVEEEEVEDWRQGEVAAYSLKCLWRTDWTNFDPSDY